VQRVLRLIEEQNTLLLDQHPYFVRCRAKQIDREQAIAIMKQLYCFSTFFERLLARRVTEHSGLKDQHALVIARKHLREELGHVELFRECLQANGVSADEVEELTPPTFTKAMFGYLTVTIQYESEYVTNVALIQVMERIGYHFFRTTLELLQSHGIAAGPVGAHAQEDIEHAQLGLELLAQLDDNGLDDCCRTIKDVYRLMSFMLAEWLGVETDVIRGKSGQLASG
jgi:pyrroloquinoline quinone (PQQ) biosynthesis protein C